MTADERAAARRRARMRAISRAARDGGGVSNGGPGRRLLRAILVTLGALIIVGAGIAGAGGVYVMNRYNQIAGGVVPPEQLISKFSRGGAQIYDRNGKLLYEVVDELGGLRRPVALADISPWMPKATVATEDASFYTNNGLNTRGLARAGIENLTPFGTGLFGGSGGSSITQQLAKNVYIPRDERAQRSIDRKVKEMVIALELTKRYSKDQILEWYLNSIPYGSIYTGVEAASQGYFGKDAKDLTLAEAALLAGIPQSPAAYAPHAGDATLDPSSATKRRQLEVLHLMVAHGQITQAQADQAAQQPIAFKTNRFDIEAPHFVLNRVIPELKDRFGEDAVLHDGLQVTTSLNLDLQHQAEDILAKNVAQYGDPANSHNGATIVLDPLTGEILTYVGSADYFNDSIQGRVDNITAQNSPGSTLKPWTYMTAFTKGWGTGTAILDTPLSLIDYATGQAYTPRDPIAAVLGPIPAHEALGNSLNIPAVKTIVFAGVKNVEQMLRQVGYTTLHNPNGYGPSLTVGGVDITLEDQAIAYSVLATDGVMRGQDVVVDPTVAGERSLEPVSLLKVTDSTGKVLYNFEKPVERRVLPAEFPYLITSVLSNGQNQCITYGVCNALALADGRPSGAKTGTSEPYIDSPGLVGDTWTMGYTPNLVAGVWAGNSDNSPITALSSTTVALHTWKEVMMAAVQDLKLPPTPFARPPGVVEKEVCWPSGKLPTDLCPQLNRYTSLYAASALPSGGPDKAPDLYDSWWQNVKIDTRTGLLAAPATPANFVKEEVRLVFPPDEVKGWTGLDDWADKHNVRQLLAPSEESSAASALVSIASPLPSANVRGRVIVLGHADSPKFEGFELDWGRGAAPGSWVRIAQSPRPVVSGTLGIWDTSNLPNGVYTLRAMLTDGDRGQTYYQVSVTVNNGNAAPTTDQAPAAVITSPSNNSVVSGTVSVTGVATAGNLASATVEVGPGLNPTQWFSAGSVNQPVLNGQIATWDTTAVADGTYTVRLTVTDAKLGSAVTTITVAVKNPATPAPGG